MNRYISFILMLQVFPVFPFKLKDPINWDNSAILEKIVGGSVVNPKYKYPYQAFYRPGGDYICGGTIINKNHVLTAGHCINANEPHSLHYVIVGHHRIARKDAFGSRPEDIFGPDVIRVKRFIKRRDRKDIAILELVRDIEFTDRIQPACIPGRNDQNYAGWNAVVTGWGGTVGYRPEDENVDQVGSELLKETNLEVLDPNSSLCRKARGNRDHMLCAYNQGNDACQGDSGGPLTVREGGKFVLIGVVSGGAGCGAEGHAGTYSRVTHFGTWIRQNVGDVCTQTSSRPTGSDTPRPSNPRPYTPQSNTPLPTTPQSYNPVTMSCSCSNFINANGYGQCKKGDSDFGGSLSCYVNLPSSCSDLERSGTHPGKYLSAEACRSNSISSQSSRPLQDFDNPTPKPYSGCSCNDFMNPNGYGQCKKRDSDFGGSFSCYVNVPSSCSDLVGSETHPGKYLSAQAC